MLEPVTQFASLEASGARTRRAGTQAATQELPDLLLIERARSGEERAIEALIRRYSRRMFRVARSLLDEDAAESVVRDAYLAAFGDLNRYSPTGKFAAWLTRLAFNQARALHASARSGPLTAPRQPPPPPTPASAGADEAQRRLAPDVARRVRAAPGFLELTPERLDRIVRRVLAQLSQGSMLTISASPP